MSDVFTPEMRSYVMRKVKSSKNLSTELKLIQVFKILNITGWKRNYQLIGSPDFTFPQKRLAIFTDGCFWHGHNCRNLKPVTNNKYWQTKIDRNKIRDKNVNKELISKGWIVYRFWECEINNEKIISRKLLKIFEATA